MRQLKSINHCLDIMELFLVETEKGCSLGEVTAACGLTKAATHTILANLVQRDYLAYDPNRRRYFLGIRTWELGARYLDSIDFIQIVQPVLRALVEITGETALLSRYTHGYVVYLDSVLTTASVATYTKLGARAPAYCTATGKAQLAFAPSSEVDHFCAQEKKRYTEYTITGADALRSELHHIRESGYAINRGEYSPDVTGVGAPVFSRAGDLVGGIGISGPAYRLGRDPAGEVCHAVLTLAASLQTNLVGTAVPLVSFEALDEGSVA